MRTYFSASRRLLLENALIDLGLRDYSRRTVRFIVLGLPRTGSNLLGASIAHHPNTLMSGELFDRARVLSEPYPVFPWTKLVRRLFPLRFMKRRIFRRLGTDVQAAGFKIFYHHCNWWPAESVWDFLLENEDVHVIHLKRKNLLRAHLSLMKAMKTRQWVRRDGEDYKDISIELDPDACERSFKEAVERQDHYDELFAGHKMLQVSYEDLAADHDGQMDRVWKFLELSHIESEPHLKKQSSLTLRESIENYDELKTRFKDTPWEEFIDE